MGRGTGGSAKHPHLQLWGPGRGRAAGSNSQDRLPTEVRVLEGGGPGGVSS